MDCLVESELVQKESETVLGPEKFVWRDVQRSSTQGETIIAGLRDTTDQSYEWFCEHFMECVIPTAEWKLFARRKRLSEYVTPTLEAFALLIYRNAYEKWNEEFTVNEQNSMENEENSNVGGDGMSSLTSSKSVHGFLYTGESKGSRKYEGWNPAGMRFYNDVLGLIVEQRGRTGCPFERNLLNRLATKPKGGRGSDDGRRAPRASNHVEQLMQIVGV